MQYIALWAQPGVKDFGAGVVHTFPGGTKDEHEASIAALRGGLAQSGFLSPVPARPS